MAGGGEAARVNLGVRGQDIQAAHGVPKERARGGLAHEEHLAAGHGVLLGGGAEAGEPTVGPGVVDTLALADGVECEHDVAELNESLAAALVEGVAFAVGAVAHLKEDAGIRRCAALGQVEIGGDEKARAALIDDLLDGVPAAIQGAGGAEIERRALGQGTGELLEGAARPCLVVANGRRGVEGGDADVAAGVGRRGEIGKIVGQAAGILAEADAGGRRLRAQGGRGEDAGGREQGAAGVFGFPVDSDC